MIMHQLIFTTYGSKYRQTFETNINTSLFMYLITITKHDSVLNNNTIQVCFKEVQGTTKEFGSYNPPNNLCCEKTILSKPKYPLLM